MTRPRPGLDVFAEPRPRRDIPTHRRKPRLRVEPLLEYANLGTVSQAARILNTDPRNFKRWDEEGGLTLHYAEQFAEWLGVHPREIWGEEYDLATSDRPTFYPRDRKHLARTMNERELQSAVKTLAKLNGWLTYHNPDSRHSDPGFPDLVLVKPPNVLFVELKSYSGRIRPEQVVWAEGLERSEKVHYRMWKPEHFDEAVEVLTGKRDP